MMTELNSNDEIHEFMWKNAKSDNMIYRLTVASNVYAPAEILEHIFDNDPAVVVKKTVISNASAPKSVISKVISDNNTEYIISLFHNPNVPQSLFYEYEGAEDKDIISAMMENEFCPPDIMLSFASQNSYNLFIAIEQDNFPVSALRSVFQVSTDVDILFYIARNNNCPIDILEKLAYHEEDSVAHNVACNKSTSLKILEDLLTKRSVGEVAEEAFKNIKSRVREGDLPPTYVVKPFNRKPEKEEE